LPYPGPFGPRQGVSQRTMTYDPEKHHRRSIRLRGYDYAGGGAYFITICVQNKGCLLGRIVESQMIPSEAGQVVQQVWLGLTQRFPIIRLDAFQIMPNHLHGVFVIPGPGLEPSLAAATGAPVVQPYPSANKGTASRSPADHRVAMGDVVGAFKSIATIQVNHLLSRRGTRLLQENFFEHIIRNVDSLEKVRAYIAVNPARWSEDPENSDRPPENPSDPW
jgi:putative transposase